MADHRDFYLLNRNGVWYYRLRGEKTFRSTRLGGTSRTSRHKAEEWVRTNKVGRTVASEMLFREYAEPFYDWDAYPRIRRKRKEGKRIGRTHARTSRLTLRNHVFADEFAGLAMGDIRRGHVVDLRDRLSESLHPATVHKALSAVKAILTEAFYREEIPDNLGAQVGSVSYTRAERGVLTSAELSRLFSEIPGAWGARLPYSVFNAAARTGMRAGEVLALQWDAVDFSQGTVDVHRAWQGNELVDQVKSLKRVIPVSNSVLGPLAALRDDGIRTRPEDLVFCHEFNGARLGQTWWRKHFVSAMEVAGIDWRARNVTGHSLRHSLNTHLLARGANEAKLRGYFGWSEGASFTAVLTTVQAGYTHWSAADLSEVASEVDVIFTSS